MRYCIQPATSTDVALLAAILDETSEPGGDEGEGLPIERLLHTCARSTQIWAARDHDGTPSALWGVAPGSDDPSVGHLWMLACEAFDNDPTDLEGLCRLVFGEMLTQFPRIENFIDSRKVRALSMLRSIGFAVEPVLADDPASTGDVHRVWIDADRLHAGRATSRLAN